MSKSRGNVIDPNDVVDEYGADVLRTYVLFMGDYEKAAPWSQSSIRGCKRFLDRVWSLQDIMVEGEEYSNKLRSSMHKTIKKVTEDIEGLKFNTAIAQLMTLLNEITQAGSINKAELKTFLLLLDPFAPHISEEMYENITGEILCKQTWPEYDEKLCIDQEIEIVVQINGKVKAKLNVPVDISKEDAIALALENDKIQPLTAGKDIIKQIYVPKKLVNIVVK
jgi:leucyl-tRNA synthetase